MLSAHRHLFHYLYPSPFFLFFYSFSYFSSFFSLFILLLFFLETFTTARQVSRKDSGHYTPRVGTKTWRSSVCTRGLSDISFSLLFYYHLLFFLSLFLCVNACEDFENFQGCRFGIVAVLWLAENVYIFYSIRL